MWIRPQRLWLWLQGGGYSRDNRRDGGYGGRDVACDRTRLAAIYMTDVIADMIVGVQGVEVGRLQEVRRLNLITMPTKIVLSDTTPGGRLLSKR